MTANFDQLLNHFRIAKRQGDKAICHCPTHDDKRGSLYFTLDGSRILGYCFAGCQIVDVLAAVNLKLSDLFLDGEKAPEAIYQYPTKEGGLAYEKVKYWADGGGKTFRQRRLDAEGKITYDLKGIQRVPYNYPGVAKAIKNGEVIVWPEGEKDAETARILGYAYSTMGGASDWRDEWKGFFRNARVVLASDNDKPGISLVQNITKSLCEVCKSVKAVILPEGKDLTEWVALGHSRADLDKLIAEAPELVKSDKFDWHNFAIDHDALLSKDLPPLDYLVDGLIVTPGTAILAAPKKRAKSWMALQLSQSTAAGAPFLGMATRQGSVIHMALEDGERRLRQRLKMQNAAVGLPITYITKFEPLNRRSGFEALAELIREKHPALVVIDTLAAAKNRFLDENEAGATADMFNQLHNCALNENTVILMVAHHGKTSTGDAGFDIRGSSAIPGATDVNIGLYKNTDGTYELKAEGRDIGEVDLRISFDAEFDWCWQCHGDTRDIRRAEAENRIIEAIDVLKGNVEASAIASELDLNRVTVQTHLKRMRAQGLVSYEVKGRKILYGIPPTTPTLPTLDTTLQDLPVGNVSESITSKTEANRAQSVGPVRSVGNTGKPLVMPVEKALEIWRSQGAPLIQLGPGEKCEDLEKLLSNPNVADKHLESVRAWIEKVLKQRGEA